jgi:hypothetical protein
MGKCACMVQLGDFPGDCNSDDSTVVMVTDKANEPVLPTHVLPFYCNLC